MYLNVTERGNDSTFDNFSQMFYFLTVFLFSLCVLCGGGWVGGLYKKNILKIDSTSLEFKMEQPRKVGRWLQIGDQEDRAIVHLYHSAWRRVAPCCYCNRAT